ncbi:peptidylprolyl isomerase [Inhella inkyongensis]|uniref:peptidylprolyl isomerase n=1 Tax=Inhella inkyongensis TaxID=392593 RepID=A0A840RYT0_9BURK|nr:peptidylprolyl isomerase [Inhella inkyongensis]MBB5203917.1 peptidylprolyl isomerase [Inhella inkyongensis]
MIASLLARAGLITALALTLLAPDHSLAAPAKKSSKTSAVTKKKTTAKPAPKVKPGAVAAAIASGAAVNLPSRSPAEVLSGAPEEAWRNPAPENLVLMELQTGAAPAQVLMELAPRFAPAHASNIRALVRGGYFDGLAVLRVQDNFVTQWGDPTEGEGARALPAGASAKLPAEFSTALTPLPFTPLAETDGWAPGNGFVDGFPVAVDREKNKAWIAHCYGVIGAGRGSEADSSNGSSLYAVIGQAPRALDLNITTVARVLKGIEHLAALPRGSGQMGFYGAGETRTPILRTRLLADMPEAERPSVKVLRDDHPVWNDWVAARRNRSGWFVHNPGRVDLCSTTPPVRITGLEAKP